MKRQLYPLFVLCVFALLVTACGTSPALAGNTNLTARFSGPKDTYKIELFEVGAPYPSRQSVGTGSRLNPVWHSIVTDHRNYFIRVTTKKGEAKQTGTFWMHDNPPKSLWVSINWNSPNLGLKQSWQ
jgi:hypothetical protein